MICDSGQTTASQKYDFSFGHIAKRWALAAIPADLALACSPANDVFSTPNASDNIALASEEMQIDKTTAAEGYRILACGSNGSFQLGLGNDQDHDTLQQVLIAPLAHMPPQAFAFGGNHTLVLFPNGELYATGSNEFGQCGLPKPPVLRTFTRVPGRWLQISAGWEFSVLYSQDGKAYSCGHGPKGELGLGEGRTIARDLSEITLDEEIVKLRSSLNHTIAEVRSGKLIGWGSCRKGQLGPQEPIFLKSGNTKPLPAIWAPSVLSIAPKRDFHIGRDRTVIVGDKTIVSYGADSQNVEVASTKVRCMWSSVHYRPESTGQKPIVSLGNNLHGQLFDYKTPSPVVDFEVGSEHGLVLLLNNTVCAWGWGEHGNCGTNNTESVTFDYANEIYTDPAEVIQLGGGQATTWIVTRAT